MIKRYKIPTIIGIIVLLIGTVAGVYFLQTNQVFRIGAGPTVIPKNIRTSNLSGTSATISWVTEGATSGFVSWGESQKSLSNIEKESETDQKFFTHSITLTGLKPGTTYFYNINSEGSNFDNNGVPWQFATGPQLSANQNSNPVTGSVLTSSGQPSKRALVYIDVGGYLLSTLTSDAGNFVLQLANIRTSDLKQLLQINNSQTLLTVSVQAEGGETASAQIFPQSANPIPPLLLGQVKDYRNLPPVKTNGDTDLGLNLPSDGTQGSKFDTSTDSAELKPTSVILESIDDGETITSTQPEFFGKGPGGEEITITIHSEQIPPETVQVPSNGSWSYSPSVPLSEGPHSITISWLDATGITRTLTRNFVVQAGEAPAFVSTPSGSSPTPTASATPNPTTSPTPTASASASATPKITPTPDAESLPVSGNLTPTLLLSIMGIAILLFGAYIWKFSDT